MRTISRQTSGGFSATDLLATLTVIGLIVALAMPAALGSLRTYRRNLAAWELTTELRRVQSLAVARGEVFVLQWASTGDDGAYRIVRDDGGCSLPAADAPVDGVSVLRGWTLVDDEYAGIRLSRIEDGSGRTLAGVGYVATGSATAPCSSATFPIRVELSDGDGNVETIEVRRSGLTSRR